MNKDFYNSVKNELFNNILSYWDKFSRDFENHGFYGEIDNDNIQNKEIDVVIVLSGGFCSTIPSEKLAEYLEPLKSKKIISMAIPLPLEGSYHTYSGCEDV